MTTQLTATTQIKQSDHIANLRRAITLQHEMIKDLEHDIEQEEGELYQQSRSALKEVEHEHEQQQEQQERETMQQKIKRACNIKSDKIEVDSDDIDI